MNRTRIGYVTLVGVLTLGFGLLHAWHVSTLFENDRHFSHLSELEREMSFRTEMGMYYYYYKLIIGAPTWQDGLKRVRNDNLSQYPSIINAETTYTLLPEITAGSLYRFAEEMGLLEEPDCWRTARGEGRSIVVSCQGMAVPSYFYITIVWSLAMMTGSVLFLYSTYLSGTIYGGLLTILAFFCNHSDCTRVQWTPPLRESFAYPILLYHMFRVTVFLDKHSREKSKVSIKSILWDNFRLDIFMSTAVCLWSWQFSQYIFSLEISILLILQWIKVIPRHVTLHLLFHHLLAVAVTTYLGPLSLSALYSRLVLSATYVNRQNAGVEGLWRHWIVASLDVITTHSWTVILRVWFLQTDDYTHIINLLVSKFTNFQDFHTLIYTCSPEFDYLPYETYEIIVKTFLFPSAVLGGYMAVYYWYRRFEVRGYLNCIEPAIAFNGLLTGAFIIMAFLVMRLKLFMTPHLCIISGIIFSRRYLELLGIKSEQVRMAFFVAMGAIMTYHGAHRIKDERLIYGEYSNIEQEELFTWVTLNTPKNAVFAGKMPIMANLLLATGRPIVNNPYYESAEMRDRTLKVYEIYSRKEAAIVYETLRKMQVDYVVLDESTCYNVGTGKKGCRMVDIWDVVDNGRGRRLGKTPICPILYAGDPHPFRRVFANNRYVVLRLDFSTYVELKPPVLKQF